VFVLFLPNTTRTCFQDDCG